MSAAELYVGIDVQVRRGLPYCILDRDAAMTHSGWVEGAGGKEQAECMRETLHRLTAGARLAIGIDAPRMPLPTSREWYWDGADAKWRRRRPAERGYGRHCEVVVSALRLANPQWTPLIGESPPWMRLGYSLFGALDKLGDVYEVFPSASYTVLRKIPLRATIDLTQLKPGPKDMLDAIVAAVTVREFANGRGWEAGGGDRLGSIILPGPKPAGKPFMQWPTSAA